MKNLIFLIAFLPAIAFGSPFLVSDPSTDGATHWQVEIDGIITESFEGGTVHYDLADIAAGEHVVRARFNNEWDVSEWSAPFPFERPGPLDTPGNLKIKP